MIKNKLKFLVFVILFSVLAKAQFNSLKFEKDYNKINLSQVTDDLAIYKDKELVTEENSDNYQSAYRLALNNKIQKEKKRIIEQILDYSEQPKKVITEVVEKIPEAIVFSNNISKPLNNFHITSNYGIRFHPIDKKSKFHSGIDLRAKYENVYSIFDAKVKDAGFNKGLGYYVVLENNNVQIIYGHLNSYAFNKGDFVRAGEIIGISGNTGKSTAPHLHFSVKEKGKYIDPVDFLKKLFIN